jgi:hypothetical protein
MASHAGAMARNTVPTNLARKLLKPVFGLCAPTAMLSAHNHAS